MIYIKKHISNIVNYLPVHNLEIKPNNRFLLLNIILYIIEFVLILIFLPFVFETNDDATMNSIASGAISGNPSKYLIITSVIIGSFLKLMYSILPNINWYSWYLIFSFFAGYLAIQYSFSQIKNDLWIKIIRHILILTILLSSLLILQFTRVAAVSLAGGFLLIFFTPQKKYITVFFGVMLIVLGALIRHHVFLMYLLLSIPFVFILLLKKQKHTIIYLSIAIFLSLLAIKYDNYIYESKPVLKEFIKFKKLRSKITTHDNPSFNYYTKKEITETINWTKSDFHLATFFNIDVGHPKFTVENLELIIEKPEPFLKKTFSHAFLSILKGTFYSMKNYLMKNYEYVVFYLIFFLFLSTKWKETFIIFIYFSFIAFLAFLLYFYLGGGLKARVFFGMSLPILLLAIYYLDFTKLVLFKKNILKFINKQIIILTFIIIAALPLVLSIIAFHKKTIHIVARIERSKLIYKTIKQKNDKLYLSWIPLSYNIFDLPFNSEQKYALGWLVNSPFNKLKIEKYTGQNNIGIYNIFNKKIVWYFTNDKINIRMKTLVTTFYNTNYDNCTIKTEKLSISKEDSITRVIYFISKKTYNDIIYQTLPHR